MPGKRPSLKQKTKALINRQKIMKAISEGRTVLDTAAELGMAVQSVRRHMRYALRSESLYPSSLNAQQAGELRQTIAQRLDNYNQKLATAARRAEELLRGSDTEIALGAVCALARVGAAAAKISSELSKLYGLYAPVKIVEESLRVTLSRSEKRVTLSFDAGALEAPTEPIPGLSVWSVGRQLAGVSETTNNHNGDGGPDIIPAT